MTTNISDYINVSDQLEKLNGIQPEGISILPVAFDALDSFSDQRSYSEASTVKTLMRNNNIPFSEIYKSSQKPKYIQNNSFEWVAPTLFISSFFLTQNPALVAIALSVIANYATDFLKGHSGEKKIKIDIVVETSQDKKCKKISYDGNVDGLKNLEKIIKEVGDVE